MPKIQTLLFPSQRDVSVLRLSIRRSVTSLFFCIVFLSGLCPAFSQVRFGPVGETDPATLCAMEVARQERLNGIPSRLLHAISLAESGRYDSNARAVRAWPWTVMAEGRGRYLTTKQEALAEVRSLQAQGIGNIDVGCMQVNLRHHPDAFSSLEEAFEPSKNVAYAARFLSSLFDTTGNWTLAASYYHSQTPHLAAAYRKRLVQIWEREKGAGSQFDDLPQNNFFQVARNAADLPTGKSLRAQAKQERTEAEKLEAKRIADAYREARIREYQYRKAEQLALRTGGSFLPASTASLSAAAPSSEDEKVPPLPSPSLPAANPGPPFGFSPSSDEGEPSILPRFPSPAEQ